jgi:thymidylate synthase (FAD)
MEIAEKLDKPSSPLLDDILGQPIKVLDQGFVRVIDYMGNDQSIVQAARVSYGKGTKKVSEDRGLIRYLLRHSHTTPFEMCVLKLHVRVPMDCWRQWIRHRMSSVNEYSTRYSEAIDACQTTNPGEWRLQSGNNKQGSAGFLDQLTEEDYAGPSAQHFTDREILFHKAARALYEERIQAGIAKEQARKDLPLSNYTEAYWKIDLHNLLHFLSLRMDTHAQKEIRDYASVIGNEIVARWCPLAWEAFNDYNFRRGALLLTRLDKEIIGFITGGLSGEAVSAAMSFGWLERKLSGEFKNNREREEFEGKARQLGISLPW